MQMIRPSDRSDEVMLLAYDSVMPEDAVRMNDAMSPSMSSNVCVFFGKFGCATLKLF
jgi:hypothetical protein